MGVFEFLQQVGAVFTEVIAWIPDVFETMVSSPIMIVIFSCALIGTVIAFAKKIMG